MREIYDDGYYMLGQVKYIIEYAENEANYTSDNEDIIFEIVKELKEDYDESDVVLIYYDNPMGYDIKVFSESDICYVGGKKW